MVVSPYSQCRHQPARRPLRNADNRSPPRRGGQQSNQQTKSKTVRPEQNTPRKSAEPISRSIQPKSQLSFAQLKLLSRPSWSRPRDSGLQRQGGVGTARPWSRSSAVLRSPFPPPSHNSHSIARRSSISEIAARTRAAVRAQRNSISTHIVKLTTSGHLGA